MILITKKNLRMQVIIPRVRKELTHIMKILGNESKEVSVLFTDNEEIQKLNKLYLQKDCPTNVISFPMQEGDCVLDNNTLGDIVISIDTAREEALAADIPLDDAIDALLIHGLLHLLGYNHERVSQKTARTMRAKENEIFFSRKGYHLLRDGD